MKAQVGEWANTKQRKLRKHERENKKEETDFCQLNNVVLNFILDHYEYEVEMIPKHDVLEMPEESQKTFGCDKCNFAAKCVTEVAAHKQTIHQSITVDVQKKIINKVKCDRCSYECNLNIQLKQHVKNMHSDTEATYTCSLCAFGAEFIGDMWKHKLEKHTETIPEFRNSNENSTVQFNLLAEYNTTMMHEINDMKKGFSEAFEHLVYSVQDLAKNLEEDASKKHIEVAKALATIQERLKPEYKNVPGPKDDPKVTPPSEASSSTSPDPKISPEPVFISFCRFLISSFTKKYQTKNEIHEET